MYWARRINTKYLELSASVLRTNELKFASLITWPWERIILLPPPMSYFPSSTPPPPQNIISGKFCFILLLRKAVAQCKCAKSEAKFLQSSNISVAGQRGEKLGQQKDERQSKCFQSIITVHLLLQS